MKQLLSQKTFLVIIKVVTLDFFCCYTNTLKRTTTNESQPLVSRSMNDDAAVRELFSHLS